MKAFYIIVGALSIIASFSMFVIGNNSSHLSELADFFWIPLPLALFALIAGFRK